MGSYWSVSAAIFSLIYKLLLWSLSSFLHSTLIKNFSFNRSYRNPSSFEGDGPLQQVEKREELQRRLSAASSGDIAESSTVKEAVKEIVQKVVPLEIDQKKPDQAEREIDYGFVKGHARTRSLTQQCEDFFAEEFAQNCTKKID